MESRLADYVILFKTKMPALDGAGEGYSSVTSEVKKGAR